MYQLEEILRRFKISFELPSNYFELFDVNYFLYFYLIKNDISWTFSPTYGIFQTFSYFIDCNFIVENGNIGDHIRGKNAFEIVAKSQPARNNSITNFIITTENTNFSGENYVLRYF